MVIIVILRLTPNFTHLDSNISQISNSCYIIPNVKMYLFMGIRKYQKDN